jgi:SAM-dependent methyltransferase
MKGWLARLAAETFVANRRDILDLVGSRRHDEICDLGCDDGVWTEELARAAGSRRAYGVEIVRERAVMARGRGVEAVVGDLNHPLPFADGAFDLVHANQVIEHIATLDTFLSEIERVLRPGGTAIVSTENGSSWHNIAAAVCGWQMFSLTNVSPRAGGLGNPLALHRGAQEGMASWTHKTIFNYRGLLEILDLYGLRPTAVRGAGYHPLPVRTGRWDARHAHLLAVRAVKAVAAS